MSHTKTSRLRAALAAVTLAVALAAGLGAAPAPAASAATTNIYNENSGRCLGINYTNHNAGIWNCTEKGNDDQTWYFNGRWITGPYGIQYGMIENAKGQCLGVGGGSTAANAQIVGWTCLPTHHDQYWNNDCVYESGQGCVLANLNTPLNGYSAGGKIIGVAGGGTANGTNAVLWYDTLQTGHFHPDQNWYFAG